MSRSYASLFFILGALLPDFTSIDHYVLYGGYREQNCFEELFKSHWLLLLLEFTIQQDLSGQ